MICPAFGIRNLGIRNRGYIVMKKSAALLCSFAMLFSFTSCGIEKPDPELRSSGNDLKTFNIKDSRIKTDLSDRFRINASISGDDGSNLSSYELRKISLTEDQIAETIMSETGFIRDDKEDGVVEYRNDMEKLDVQLTDQLSMNSIKSPSITYSLDKGKEYKAVVENNIDEETPYDEEAKKAEELVKEILDKLHIEYGEFSVVKTDYYRMNDFYRQQIQDQKEMLEAAGSGDAEEYLTDDLELYKAGKYELLDKTFKFTEGDDCYCFYATRFFNGLPLTSGEENHKIFAAVSSRGVEYLYADNIYSSDSPFQESPVIPVEQAVNTLYNEFEEFKAKDEIKVNVDKICLSYLKTDASKEGSGGSQKLIVPVWSIHCYQTDPSGGNAFTIDYHVSALDGKKLYPEYDTFFSYGDVFFE